ncbi:hypothetical protein [Microlunatus flavus]|uniref:Restriction endonuclease n=1 Tax=Microlunatus flavus TaxID=1036181 RepID=A0A1H9FRF6_9ACTN|nr:hypothetical protein [Microlunatus flavus]SEQ40093.1 hypothetical protein SAMN05421756_103346 [Microlunatus flavus]
MTPADAHGHLLPDPAGGQEAAVEPEVARRHHRLRAGLVGLLGATTPAGHEVSAACTWQQGPLLVPLDVTVHADLGPHGRLRAAPVLCVDLLDTVDVADTGPVEDAARRRRHTLGRLGVDHVWQLDVTRDRLEVYVRTDDEYRHAETVTDEDWIDYGIGLVHLDLVVLLAQGRSPAGGTGTPPVPTSPLEEDAEGAGAARPGAFAR